MTPVFMRFFTRTHFTLLFMLLLGILDFTLQSKSRSEIRYADLSFRSNITRVQAVHGSSVGFGDLSNGERLFIPLPKNFLHVGDSIIKIKKKNPLQ